MNIAIGEIKIFAANANARLAADVAKYLGKEVGKSEVGKFADGEINMRVNETVRMKDVFIIQSTAPPVNDHLMELLIMIDAMRRSSAGRITAIIPYYGYARQDRRARSHDPISAKLVADVITAAGADRILSMDLHCPQIQGFFNIPMDHLKGMNQFKRYYLESLKHIPREDVVVVSPDLGSVSRCNEFAAELGVKLAIVDKRRENDKKTEVVHFIGDVRGKHAILFDDVLTTGGSLTNAAAAVKAEGAHKVYACVTHPILVSDAIKKIEESCIEELLVLDTVEVPPEKYHPKIKILPVAETIAQAVECIHHGRSIGDLFK